MGDLVRKTDMTFWQGRNVFVPTGLLGSWVVEELLSQSARVTCLMRDGRPTAV